MPLLQPIDVKTAGVEAWVISKENAAILLAQLRQRTDFREQNSPSVPIHNGQSHTVTRTTPRTFVRSVRMRPDVWPGHELVSGQMQEGFTLQLSPLMSLDGNTIDAVIKCEVDQIEKLVPVNVDIPSVAGGHPACPDPGSAGHQLAPARTFPLAGQSSPDAGLRRRRLAHPGTHGTTGVAASATAVHQRRTRRCPVAGRKQRQGQPNAAGGQAGLPRRAADHQRPILRIAIEKTALVAFRSANVAFFRGAKDDPIWAVTKPVHRRDPCENISTVCSSSELQPDRTE